MSYQQRAAVLTVLLILFDPVMVSRALGCKGVYRKKNTSWANGHVFTGSERVQISSHQGDFLGVYVH